MTLLVNRKKYSPSKLNNTQNIIPGKILRRDYELDIEKTLKQKLWQQKE